jgi:hypothetical protein
MKKKKELDGALRESMEEVVVDHVEEKMELIDWNRPCVPVEGWKKVMQVE